MTPLSLLRQEATSRLHTLKSTAKASGIVAETDPVKFVSEHLGLELWSKQVDIVRAVWAHKRVAVRSGHKIGKSTSAAAIALAWVCTKPRARVIMTSASARQVKSILWKELRRIYRGAKRPVGGEIHESAEAGLQFEDGREVVGFSTNEPERMAGISGVNVLFVLDEASGIDEQIFEAVEGNRAGGANIVMFSNPTQTSGSFYEAFNQKREFWHCIHVSSEETPNVTGKGAAVPGLAMADWVEEKRREWGEESPLYQIRVRGDFPSQASNAVIGVHLVDAASRDWRLPQPTDGVLEIGVDVARYGDDETVIQARRGKVAYLPIAVRSMNGIEIAERVVQLVRELRTSWRGEHPPGQPDMAPMHFEIPRVKVDEIGVGASVVDQLGLSDEVEVIPVNVSESSSDEIYALQRDQIWHAIRDWLKEGGRFQSDSKLEAELVAPMYTFDARGRIKVESKADIKERIRRSPDRADALGLAIFNPPRKAWFDEIPGEEKSFMDY